MGLTERRASKDFQDNRYPGFKRQMDAAAGFDVPVDIQWDTLAEPQYSHLYDEAYPKVYFLPLVDALKAITVDDMGKDALKSGLKKVCILNSGSTRIDFATGILTFDHSPVSNLDDTDERRKRIQTALENGL